MNFFVGPQSSTRTPGFGLPVPCWRTKPLTPGFFFQALKLSGSVDPLVPFE